MVKCINCEGLALWDDDWCCTLKMEILSGLDEEKYKTLHPEVCEQERECEDFRDASEAYTSRGLALREEVWERLKRGIKGKNDSEGQ